MSIHMNCWMCEGRSECQAGCWQRQWWALLETAWRIPNGLKVQEGISLGELWEHAGLGKRKHHLLPRAYSLIKLSILTLGEINQTNRPWKKRSTAFVSVCQIFGWLPRGI